MPRRSKTESKKKKIMKAIEDDDNIDDDILEEEEETKPARKNKKENKSSKGKKAKHSDSEESDELSDLDVDEDIPPVESAENDQVVSTQKPQHPKKPDIKKIDPKTQIGELKPVEIFSYLIQLAEEEGNPNPTLRRVAVNSLLELTGRRRHPRQFQGGPPQGRLNFGPRFANRRNCGGHHGHPMDKPMNQAMPRGGHNMQARTQQMQQDLYQEEDE